VPSEGLDLDLIDRMLIAAKDEVDNIDVVCLPESAVEESELDELEGALAPSWRARPRYRRPQQPDQLPRNWVQIAQSTGEHWLRIRQNKHRRWSLDEGQIYQYPLGGALHPHIRWWEAMEVPRRSLQLVEVGEGVTVVSLVCEDLAQIDDVADLLRSVGPTLVITPLLDGPQLSSRWAARYAGVLADDPGSAVLTLTSAGTARRSRPHGRDASPVIGLWKDPVRGTREMLEADAGGVLLTASADLVTWRSGDGRQPVDNCTEFFDMGVNQVRAANAGSSGPTSRPTPTPAPLQSAELTILTSWAEAVAEVRSDAPARARAVLADPLPGAPCAPPSELRSHHSRSAVPSTRCKNCPVGHRYNGSTDVKCSPRCRQCQRAWRTRTRRVGSPRTAIRAGQRQMRLKRTGRYHDRSA
jgi:hypothetical protein